MQKHNQKTKSKNKIKKQYSIYTGMKKLKVINLSYNNIASINNQTFFGLNNNKDEQQQQ